jgi:hypothetical protein
MPKGNLAVPGAGLIHIGRVAWGPTGTARVARAQQQIFADLRFARDVEAIRRLGPRPIAELLAEIGRAFLFRSDIDSAVTRYARRLTPEMLAATGGDRMPVPPFQAVGGGRR